MDIKKIFRFILPRTKLNKSLKILIVANTSMVFIIGMLAPFYAVFVQKLGGGIAFAGLSWAIFSIVAGILTFFLGQWQMKIKEQELLLALGYLIRGVVFLSYAFMGSIAQLIVTQIFWGVGAALGSPAFDSMYSLHTDQKNSISQWGQWEAVASISTGLAAIVGGVLIQSFGYAIVFLGMSVLSTLLGIYIWRLPREVL